GVYIHRLVGASRHAGTGLPDDVPHVLRPSKTNSVPAPEKAAEPPHAAFPRRFLAITIHQYLYANSTSPFAPSLGPGRPRRLLANALRDMAQNQLRVSPGQL